MRFNTIAGLVMAAGMCLSAGNVFGQATEYTWKHLSTANGDLEVPNKGTEQTSSIVLDIDKDGDNDFVITERTKTPSVVWYRRTGNGWDRYVLEDAALHIEAGSDYFDIDGDGDLDVLCGGDSQSNRIWWWENPYPNFDKKKSWTRREVKNFGANKHHDQKFADVDGDGQVELVYWNQGGRKLYVAEIPDNVKGADSWESTVIYSWNNDSEMKQRGTYPGFKSINEHEGLDFADIDGDGKTDIVGGGRWFKHVEGTTYLENIVDAGYSFSRAGAGQLIEGGRPEIVLVVGDGVAPLVMYEWQKGTWLPTILVDEVDNGHSLDLLDFNGDGHLDIWNAEMRLGGGNPDAKNYILFGDGQGNFTKDVISTGIANHESKIADLDNDGDYDVLDKPYGWDTPRIDIWLNMGPK